MFHPFSSKKLFSILLICTFGSYVQADTNSHAYTDSLFKKSFFSISIGRAIENAKFSYPVIQISYGRNLRSKSKYVGAFEIGWAIGPVMGPSFKYEYDFLNESTRWSGGINTSVLFGHSAKPNLATNKLTMAKLTMANELGIFLEMAISKSLSASIRFGSIHQTNVNPFTFKQNNIDTHFGLGIRYYLN